MSRELMCKLLNLMMLSLFLTLIPLYIVYTCAYKIIIIQSIITIVSKLINIIIIKIIYYFQLFSVRHFKYKRNLFHT